MLLASSTLLALRLARVREQLVLLSLDGLIISHVPNVTYLTNFSGTAAVVVLTRDRLYFITDFRYSAAVQSLLDSTGSCSGAELVRVERTYDETLVETLRRLALPRIGFEAAYFPVSRYNWLVTALGGSSSTGSAGSAGAPLLVPTERVVERLRLRKDSHEVFVLRTAAGLLSRVACEVLGSIRTGRSEWDIALEVDWAVRRAGFERPAFDTIVASGPNSALPHAQPGSRVLSPGDLVVLDFGGVYDGYCVDLTRTVSVGDPGSDARRLHTAVGEAQRAAIAAVRPGVRASEVDAAARAVLATHGLAEAFGHSTGHGLGLELHEEPRVGRGRDGAQADATALGLDELLLTGMVFTVEPGVYVPGVGGVRIEDDILVTENGCEILTDVSRELRVN